MNEGRLPIVFKQYMPVPPTYVWFNIPNPTAPFHLPFLVLTSLPQHCTISDLLMRACVWVLFLFRLELDHAEPGIRNHCVCVYKGFVFVRLDLFPSI
jgi:hypothetical protein